MINVANLSPEFPFWVSEKEYEELKLRKNRGWSECTSSKEWLIKLHYLRTGYKEGKIEKKAFFAKEKELVIKWWLKQCGYGGRF